MRAIITIMLFSLVFLIPFPALAQQKEDNLQLQKETALVETLKKLMTCKNIGVSEEGNLYCSISFRGLTIEFAGVNAKGGGNLYVTSLGPKQTVGMRGSRCMVIMFGDMDLRGVINAHVLFRNDGVITYTHKNHIFLNSLKRRLFQKMCTGLNVAP